MDETDDESVCSQDSMPDQGIKWLNLIFKKKAPSRTEVNFIKFTKEEKKLSQRFALTN